MGVNLSVYQTNVIIALGSNIGNFKFNFKKAILEISKFSNIISIGNTYLTKPYGNELQNNFYNTAIQIITTCQPLELMDKLKLIENKLMKNKKIINGPRRIDLDIIFFGSKVIKNSKIEIPHPRAMVRDFVLKPISDFSPHYKDPLSKKTVKQVLKELKITYIIKSLNSSYLSKEFL